MPIFTSTAPTPKVLAMSGNAVAITVASRFSMKKVTATNKAIKVERRWEIDVIAVHSWFRTGTLSISGFYRRDFTVRAPVYSVHF